MAPDRRAQFIKKWQRKAERTADPFDCFFSAWIALVVAAQRTRDQYGPLPERDSDRKRMVDYFGDNRGAVVSAVATHRVEMEWVARRRGTKWGGAIVDTGNQDLRVLFDKLSRYYVDSVPIPDDERVKATAELLNKMRNNVFHGIKVYDDKDDMELLEHVNPILLAILQETER